MVETETVSMGYCTPLPESINHNTQDSLTDILEAVFGPAQKYQA
jgi:hypothetical protein